MFADAFHGVPGPVQVSVVPSPASQTIPRGTARAVIVRPPADAVAVWVRHQPGRTHHQTGTCTTCVLVSDGFAAITGLGMTSWLTARCVTAASAAGGAVNVTTPL